MKKFVSVMLLTVFSINSFAIDVVGKRETIVVEHNKTNDSVSFKHCVLDKKGEFIEDTCQRIGSKDSYTRDELADIKAYEITDAVGKIALDAGILAGTAFFAVVYGVTVGSLIYFASSGKYAASIAAAAGLTAAATQPGFYIPFVWKKLNPVRQTEQAMALSRDFIDDKLIEEDDKQVLYLVKILNEIL